MRKLMNYLISPICENDKNFKLPDFENHVITELLNL